MYHIDGTGIYSYEEEELNFISRESDDEISKKDISEAIEELGFRIAVGNLECQVETCKMQDWQIRQREH